MTILLTLQLLLLGKTGKHKKNTRKSQPLHTRVRLQKEILSPRRILRYIFKKERQQYISVSVPWMVQNKFRPVIPQLQSQRFRLFRVILKGHLLYSARFSPEKIHLAVAALLFYTHTRINK